MNYSPFSWFFPPLSIENTARGIQTSCGEIPKRGLLLLGTSGDSGVVGQHPHDCAGAGATSHKNSAKYEQQQQYATIQRKQPSVPPFNGTKGFDSAGHAIAGTDTDSLVDGFFHTSL